jgi:peptide/nickel transport system substrate-binding protein
MTRRQAIRRVAGLGAGAFLVGPALQAIAACGPSGGGSGSNSKQLVIAQGLDPETLDPHGSTTQATLNPSTAVCEPLLDVDYSGTEPKITAGLITEWKQIDPTTWEVKLRQNVKFTNGEEFNADAVKFNIERIQNPATKSPALSYVKDIAKMDVVNATTLNITTKGPIPILLLDLSKVYIVPPKYTQSDNGASLAKKPIGTGPFKFVEWLKDDHITLEANNDYWGGKPKIEKVIFKPIPEDSTRVANLKSNQADIITNLPIAEISSVEGSKDLKATKVPSLRLMFVILDATNGPTKDKRVRQALNYAVDKDALIKNTFQGNANKLQGEALSKEYFGFDPNLKPFDYDPEKAKALLADAGFANGFQATFWAPQGRYVLDKETGQAIVGQLEKVGVHCTFETRDWATYVKQLIDKTLTPLAYIGYSTFPDASTMLGINTTGNTYSYYSNKDFDYQIQKGLNETDTNKRKQIYADIVKMMQDDPPYIYLWQQVDTYGVNKRVQGWSPRPDERILLTGVSLS